MKLGFLTGCLKMTLAEKLDYAYEAGFRALEISCWPFENNRDYSASDIDVENFTEKDAEELINMTTEKNIEISALAYYDNMLHPDPQLRKKFHSHLKKVILAANKLDVKLVGTFIGKDPNLTLDENFELFKNVFTEIIEFAEKHNVKIMIENCPMPGWEKDGLPATISYSPEFWDRMFELIPDYNFGLNLDPSHLAWLGIDYYMCVEKYAERIFQVHAKDCLVHRDGIELYGIFGKKLNREHAEDLGLFTPKIPGLGDISWPKFIGKLNEVGFKGNVIIEHEDRDFEKNNDKIISGLNYAYNHLDPLIDNFTK